MGPWVRESASPPVSHMCQAKAKAKAKSTHAGAGPLIIGATLVFVWRGKGSAAREAAIVSRLKAWGKGSQ